MQPSWWLLCWAAFGWERLLASSRLPWRGGYLCLPPLPCSLDQAQATSLITFVFVCLLLVATVTALNSAVDVLLAESDYERQTQLALGQLGSLVETSDDAIITKDLNGIITAGIRVLNECSVTKPMR